MYICICIRNDPIIMLLSSCHKANKEDDEYMNKNSHPRGKLVSADNAVYFIADDVEAGVKLHFCLAYGTKMVYNCLTCRTK